MGLTPHARQGRVQEQLRWDRRPAGPTGLEVILGRAPRRRAYFFCASRYIPSAESMVVTLLGCVLIVAPNALKLFSACSRYLSSFVFCQSRTRLRAATLLPHGCAPSNWSLPRANSFS